MTKEKIFFSYSRADGSELALRLAVDLKNKGYDVWIDQQDIRAGLEWDTEIAKALESCDCVLFLETEKSVVSNNVLDEVYYALEQNKKVIPLICVDSRTPFRLHRLQHVDFTKDYDSGLSMLMKELENNDPATTYLPEEKAPLIAHDKPFYKRSVALMIIAALAILTIAVVLITKKKTAPIAEVNTAVTSTDTIADKGVNVSNLPVTPENTVKEEDETPKEKIIAIENKAKEPGKTASASSANVRKVDADRMVAKTGTGLGNLSEAISGDWRLISIEPKTQSQRGYLKIESLGENKATIKSYVQFYYPDSNAPSYLTIFNAFAGCTSCTVNKEMKLKVEDIAVGSRTVKKLQQDEADGRKAGDIISDASANKSVRGTATLQFIDNNNAVMKVKQPLTVALANELMLEPFVYIFRFKKDE